MLILHFSLQHTATHVYLAASMGGLVRVCVREILDGFFFLQTAATATGTAAVSKVKKELKKNL